MVDDLDRVEAGLLHDAHLNDPGRWIPRSRGADDAAIDAALARLEERGLASEGRVNAAGLELRAGIERSTHRISEAAWRLLGRERTERFLALVEPVGERLLARVDETAGPDWMPAARRRRD